MSWRRTGWLALALVLVAVGIGGASAFAASPPTLLVQAIGKGTVTGSGIDCGVGSLQCFAAYSSDANPVVLTATPATGWSFDHWADDATGCANPCSQLIAAGSQKTATAVFTLTAGGAVPTNSLAVSLAGQGTVANGSTADQISCAQSATPPPTGTCNITVLQGSTLAVTETPDNGFIFSSWGGACSGTGVSCAVYMSADRTVSANFASAATNTLTVVVDGSGSVTGGGISCGAGSTCDKEEPPNTAVTLTESPASGYAFTGWDGACSGTQSTCSVTMDAARSVTAHFDQLVPVVVSVNGNGTVSGAGITCGPGPQTCTGSATPNTSVLLTATPALTGSGVTWTGCTSSSGTICRISVSSTPVSVTATFGTGTGPQPSVSLSVNVNGDGYVTSTSGTTAIYCTAIGGAGCTTSIPQGTTVTLKAIAATGNANDFVDWGNDDCSTFTSTTCTLTMNTAKSATADFNGPDTTYDLTALIEGSGNVSGAGLHCAFTGGTGCTSPQAAGATVTLTAVPAFGATFVGWSGACTGTSPTCNVSMSTNKSVTALFKQAAPGKQLFTITVTGKGSVKGTAGTCTSKTGKATTCTQQYADDAKVTLTAKAAAGWAFGGWKGACTGKKATCTVTMLAALQASATFTPLPLVLTHKPRVAKIRGGYRVTIFYTARIAGTLRVLAVRGSTKVTHSKHVAKGSGRMLLTLKRAGTYHVTLSLTAKHKTTKVRFVVKT